MTTESKTNTATKKSSKKPSTGGLDRALFDEAIAGRPEGLTVEEKAAWTKLRGPSGARIYVSKAKRVKQVDLSGFGRGLAGTVKPKVDNGKVEAQLDFRGTPEQVMGRFVSLMEALAAIPEPTVEAEASDASDAPKPARKRGSSKKGSNRKTRIRERAEEMGAGA